MPGDVPDPASWVAGATKSELERLLVFLGDAADPRYGNRIEVSFRRDWQY